tara:strand:- start:242 stop:688 length:447 start_codon:yes stop_codon:yes gene_type:complete
MEQLNLSKQKQLTKSYPNTYAHSINPGIRYLFELKLTLEEEIKMIKKVENKNESELLSEEGDIDYKDIEKFNLTVLKISGQNINDYSLSGKIDRKRKNMSFSNDNLFIEFCENESGKCICKTQFLSNDELSMVLKMLISKGSNLNLNM